MARTATSAVPSTDPKVLLLRQRAGRVALLRDFVLREGRVDILARCVLDYAVRPFHLELLRFQDGRKKTLQLAPRGYGKSTMLTVCRALFEVVRNRDVRVLIASNSSVQAEVFLREVKRHAELNDTLRAVFGDLVAAEGKWTETELVVHGRRSRAKESTITCVGFSGAVVSRHYDVLLVDDLIDSELARTEGQRVKVREWFYQSLLPTLEPHGRIHLVGTRYHFSDLYGQLIEGEYMACHQVLQAIAADGSTPWPEKFSLEWLAERKLAMGSILFNSQYMNNVDAMRGRIFQREWLRTYDTAPAGLRVYMGVDLAISQKETADYFALVVVGVDQQKRIYVLEAIQRRLTFKAQTDLILAQRAAWRPLKVLIEAVAYQAAQIDVLRREGLYAIPVKTTKDKVTRFLRLAARFEAGQVLLKRGEQDDLLEQLLLAPEGQHDDLVDALEFAVSADAGMYMVRTDHETKTPSYHSQIPDEPTGRIYYDRHGNPYLPFWEDRDRHQR